MDVDTLAVIAFAEDGNGAIGDGFGDEVVAIVFEALDGDEQGAVFDEARVVLNLFYFGVGVAGDDGVVDSGCKFVKFDTTLPVTSYGVRVDRSCDCLFAYRAAAIV
jgi:hypothetical protein